MPFSLKRRPNIPVSLSLLCAVCLGSGAVLRAQNPVAPTSSPEAISKKFVAELTGVGIAQRRYHSDIYLIFERSGTVSQKSLKELKEVTAPLMFHLAQQIEVPHFKAQLFKTDGKNARVKVERDDASYTHDILLVQEKDGWKVDLVATYAAWNKISESEAKKRIRENFVPKP
jgi:hypothetical protein